MFPCLLLAAAVCALAGCGGASTETPSVSGGAIERSEHDEEVAEAKREEAAEAAKTRELLSEIEAERHEEDVQAAEAKAKRIVAAAVARAKKREREAEARVKKLEETANAEIKSKRESASKRRHKARANTPRGSGSEATTTATAPQASPTQGTGAE
jgi:hypothetical protein